MNLEDFLKTPPYALTPEEKAHNLLTLLNNLTEHHYQECPEYSRIIDRLSPRRRASVLNQVPFLPVGLFKRLELRSIPKEKIFKVLTSSGTTSTQTSRIYLDNDTASLQSKVLAAIMTNLFGSKRLPMIIVDHPAVFEDPDSLSARGAGILGMMNFGRDHFFCLNEDLTLNFEGLRAWMDSRSGQPLLIFGFTFMVWRYFYQAIKSPLDMKGSVLIHSGGWKKLIEEAVSNEIFKENFRAKAGISRIHSFYGMVEQVGSIFVECESGYLHAPSFSEVLIRNPIDWSLAPMLQQGVVQVLSILPKSYPGHSILTEDLGTIYGLDGCSCGRRGTYFKIDGRVPKTILRGCSDTHAFSSSTQS